MHFRKIFWAFILQSVCGILTTLATARLLTKPAELQAVGLPTKSKLSSEPKSSLMISMNPPMSPIIQKFSTMTFNSREEQISAMVAAMKAASTKSQAPMISVLKSFGVHMKSYWLTNQIWVKDADSLIAETITNAGAVKDIAKEKRIPFFPALNPAYSDKPNDTVWSVKLVKAPKLWKKGIHGEGIIVATIDSGARYTHEALRENYVGGKNYGWFDPFLRTKEPNDELGHGTHVIGTMVGTNGIGVAPKAKWMACKGCGAVSCPEHTLLACGQYVLCPSDHEGHKRNCTNMPHVVNNSWGGPGGDGRWFDDVIDAWKAAGIIAFFAAGNSGPDCETAGSPGDHEYPITVGSTDINDRLSEYSSRGPTSTKLLSNETDDSLAGLLDLFGAKKVATDVIKPEICAPGENIYSAGTTSDVSYKKLSGTSMASPLTAGASALLLSVNPMLTMKQMKNLLYPTAERNLKATDTPQCGANPETKFPNCMYGHGRVDIYNAYKKMLNLMRKPEEDEAEEEEEMEEKEEENMSWEK